jgi:LysW-gamma-L-lysine carboxypeptidase
MDRASAIELVRGLVAIPSTSRNESAASAWLVEQMRSAGYDRAFVDEAGNAVGELGDANAARTIVLLGHIDTVPGNIPVRIEATAGTDGTEHEVLYGRGSVDAKGPLATFVAGAARFGAAAARAANCRLIVVGAVEEGPRPARAHALSHRGSTARTMSFPPRASLASQAIGIGSRSATRVAC